MTTPPLEVYLDESKVVFVDCTESEWFDALEAGHFEYGYQTLERLAQANLANLYWVRRVIGEYV